MTWALVLVLITASCVVTKANDLRFLGTAYNLLTGNPDGTQSGSGKGGTDPGILSTRKVLKVSLTDGSSTKVVRHSCYTSETIYENSKAYQSKLQASIDVAGSVSYSTVSFGASAGFKSAEEQTTNSHSLVNEKSTLCFKGTARYHLELAQSRGFTITDSFASEICGLPSVYTQQTKNLYMSYLSRWGTHIITKVDLGTKDILRKKTSSQDVLQYAESAASGFGVSGSLSVDVSSFKSDRNFKSLFTSSLTHYVIGTNALPEPIQFSLHDVTEFLADKYWSNLDDLISRQVCPSGFKVTDIRTHMLQALKDYPAYLEVNPPQDSLVNVPLVWPEGTFGLPMPSLQCSTQGSGTTQTSSCPTGRWFTGYRMHEAEDTDNDNGVTPNHCLNLIVNHDIVQWYFCMKQDAGGAFRLKWPKGTYCLFKKGNCPSGFEVGEIKWDDEDYDNDNAQSGYLPDGIYGRDTMYQFCCRNDRYTTTPIYLPTEKPFFLIAQNQHCQQVHGMSVRIVDLYWDCEDDCCTNQYSKGKHPYNFGYTENIAIRMCYYQKI